jgi:WD40 repeat protein
MTPAETRAACPYVGLQPFEPEHQKFFFGRERDQRIIISNLLAAPLTVLYGSSGVGKSSVLMAGVVPQVRRDRPKTPVVVFRSWVGDFQASLVHACIEEVWSNGVGQPRPAETLPFDEVLRACGEAAHQTVLLLFDQFEEYFLYHPKSADPESFEAQFARAVNRDDVDVGFLIALREDGLSKLDRFQERIPHLLSNRLRLNHLDEAGASAAIRKPLEVWNREHATGGAPVEIEDRLVTELIDQVRIGRVLVGRRGGSGEAGEEQRSVEAVESLRFVEAPFLQLVMTRLWAAEMASGSSTLRLETLARLKGAKEIVRRHLDNVMDGLDDSSRAVCATFFDRLVTPTGAKVACSVEDLQGWAGNLAPHVAGALKTLSSPDNRILRAVVTSPDNPDALSYEIYHDVLAPAIIEWCQRYLEKREHASELERAQTEARERAQRQWVYALGMMFLIAVGGWGVAYWQRLRAEANQKAAESIAISPHDARRGLDRALAATGRNSWIQSLFPATAPAEDALRQAIRASLLERSLPLGIWASDVAFSADGRRLAAARKDGRVTIWDLTSEVPRPAPDLVLGEDWVRALAFLPSGDGLVTSAGDTARLWSLGGGAAERAAFKHAGGIYSALALSRDGRYLATADKTERVIKVWDLVAASPIPITSIDVAGAWVMGLAFSPDGCCLATAHVEKGSPGRTHSEIWSVASGAKILTIPNDQPSDAVAFSADGRSIVTACRDDRLRVWRPAIGDLNLILVERGAQALTATPALRGGAEPPGIPWNVHALAGHLDRVRDVAVSPDGSRIASAGGDGRAIVWDAETGERLLILAGHEGFVEAVAFSPDGQQVVTAGRDGTVKIWNVAGHTGGVHSVAFSPVESILATAGGDHTAMLWDVSTATPRWRRTLHGHGGKIYRLAFDPTGHLLATAAFDNTAKLWDAASGELLRTIKSHADQLRDLAFSSDGRHLALTSADGTGSLHDLAASNDPDGSSVVVKHNSTAPGIQASAVAFHPNLPRWVTAGWDGALQLWDLDGRNLGSIVRSGSARTAPPKFVDIAFSPDGAEITALSNHTLYAWPTSSFGRSPAEPSTVVAVATRSPCSSIEYSRDGKQLAVGCGDGGVRLYDAATRTLLKTITAHADSVTQVAFSPDGRRLATASLDNRFQVSPLDFEELHEVAKRLQAAAIGGQG